MATLFFKDMTVPHEDSPGSMRVRLHNEERLGEIVCEFAGALQHQRIGRHLASRLGSAWCHAKVEFATDSPLDGDGFERSVPRAWLLRLVNSRKVGADAGGVDANIAAPMARRGADVDATFRARLGAP